VCSIAGRSTQFNESPVLIGLLKILSHGGVLTLNSLVKEMTEKVPLSSNASQLREEGKSCGQYFTLSNNITESRDWGVAVCEGEAASLGPGLVSAPDENFAIHVHCRWQMTVRP